MNSIEDTINTITNVLITNNYEITKKELKPYISSYNKFLQKTITHVIRLLIDKHNIGTEKYRGVSYFWNIEYKHYMRDSKQIIRKQIHDSFILHELVLDECSDKHLEIIKNIVNDNVNIE